MLDEKIVSVTYSLNEKGELELATSSSPRRITDDMSELDIQLMKETLEAGVAVSDMMAMADKMNSESVKKIEPEEIIEGH